MRMYMLLIAVLFLIPSVAAVGLMVPKDIDRTIFHKGVSEKIRFTLRGDSENHRIRFFVVPGDVPVRVSEDEDGPWYENVSVVVDIVPFEQRNFDIWFNGTDELDDYKSIKYGFEYLDNVSGDVGIQQSVESTFTARVRCSSCESSTASTSSGGSSGGGSGGSYVLPEVNESLMNVSSMLPKREPVAQDVAGESEGVDKIVADAPKKKVNMQFNTPASKPNTQQESTKVKAGRGSAVLFMLMLALTMILTIMTMKSVKEGEE